MKLTDEPGTLKPLLWLAAPVLAEQLLHMLVGQSDTWITGRYLREPVYLATVNSIIYLLWLLTEVFVFLAIGSTALIARFIGAGDRESAERITNQSMLGGAVVSVAATLAGLLFGENLAHAMSLQGEEAALAARYLSYVFPVMPCIMLETVGVACLRGAGDTKSGMWAMVLVNVVHITVSWTLAVGWGPFPAWGWDGIAIGTACGHLAGGAVILGLLIRGRAGLKLRRPLLRPDWPLLHRILRIGLPGGLDMLAVLFCQLWFVKIINELGVLPAAAHGVALRIESWAFSPGTAFQVAVGTLVGQYLGAGDPRRAGRCVMMAGVVGGGFMVLMGVLFYTQATFLVGLMVGPEKQNVVEMAAPLLQTVALAMPALAAVMMISGALRGAGDTRWPLLITIVGFLGVRIPLAYLLAQSWGWGVQGAWYAMLTDLSVRAVLISYRFLHGGWKRVKV